MNDSAYGNLIAYARDPKVQEETIRYLAYHLGHFLRGREHVFICFLDHEEGNLSWLMEQAVLRCDGIPHVWGQDRRWKNLLREAFITRSTTIIGSPLLLLGLTKLKKAFETPLYIRKVVSAGYPAPQWMLDGIVKGFDCEVGGCFSLGTTGVVAGFACGRSWGVHLREDTYGVDIVDDAGNVLPDGVSGEMVLYPKDAPHLRCPMGECAVRVPEPCKCGCEAPRLMDITLGKTVPRDLQELGGNLLYWTSILDCQLRRSECGLDIEIVAFPGEKLPKLPTAARLNLRDLDVERDMPLYYETFMKNPSVSMEK